MLVSNYTFNISKEAVGSWETFWTILLQHEWKNHEHVHDMKAYFLMTEVENDGKTYAIQTFFQSEAGFNAFHSYFESYLLPLIHKQYLGQYVYFQTLLATWD